MTPPVLWRVTDVLNPLDRVLFSIGAENVVVRYKHQADFAPQVGVYSCKDLFGESYGQPTPEKILSPFRG